MQTLPSLNSKVALASHLARIVDWNIHPKTKAWVQLEHSFSPIPLSQTPWIIPKNTPPTCQNHPLIIPTLASFRETCSKYRKSSILGPMTPLRHNPDFTPGTSLSFLSDIWSYAHVRAEHFFEDDRLVSHTTLATKMTNGSFPFWTYV